MPKCPECTDYFEQDRALLDLYDRARDVSAPMAVRERVFDAIASARWSAGDATADDPGRGEGAAPGAFPPMHETNDHGLLLTIWKGLIRHGAWPTAMAVVLAVFLIRGITEDRQAAVERSDVFVEDYLRRAVGQDHIESRDPADVRRFLERELGIRVEPLRLAGFDLSRAEICLLEGRRGALIVYKRDGQALSHYLVPRDDAVERPPALSSAAAGRPSVDMPVVTWATRKMEQALVGDVSAEVLLEMAGRGPGE